MDEHIIQLAAEVRGRESPGPRRAGITAAITQLTGETDGLRHGRRRGWRPVDPAS